ncbi:hypothetical protein SmJEL517_g05390 [Synchytrium microbalum]|uniref:GST N-terminal domain-containing protein n=1 Tax=Synchytrium microbalum TaxID=1806994 RepID=A0A507BZU5_9FUNG|nr:uncharacterized protein SmJEL517_g05390 [Synchytrium microbalum]TPX31266.1 hypothetical protein SmJEL517_g05390 [Synchytrium microbalum]
MGVRLLHAPLSPYGVKVKLALYLKDVPFTIENTMPTSLAKSNPRAEVPILLDGELVIYDSGVIVNYLEDKYPSPSLFPKSAAQRAKCRIVADVCDTTIEAIFWGMNEILAFKRASGEQRDKMLATARQQADQYFDWLSAQLGNDEWFGGEDFGYADISVVPQVITASAFRITPKPGSNLAKWWVRAQKRTSVARVLAETIGERDTMKRAAASAATNTSFKRQYRDHRLEWMVRSGGASILMEGLKKGNVRFTSDEAFGAGVGSAFSLLRDFLNTTRRRNDQTDNYKSSSSPSQAQDGTLDTSTISKRKPLFGLFVSSATETADTTADGLSSLSLPLSITSSSTSSSTEIESPSQRPKSILKNHSSTPSLQSSDTSSSDTLQKSMNRTRTTRWLDLQKRQNYTTNDQSSHDYYKNKTEADHHMDKETLKARQVGSVSEGCSILNPSQGCKKSPCLSMSSAGHNSHKNRNSRLPYTPRMSLDPAKVHHPRLRRMQQTL